MNGVSGSVSFTSAGNTLRVYYAQTFTPGASQSTVIIPKVTLQSESVYGGSFFFDGKIIVNGQTVFSRSIAGSDGGVSINTDENIINLCTGGTVTVSHSAATTISIQLAANTQGYPCFYQYGYGDISIPAGSRSVTLTAIPQAYTLSVSVGTGSWLTVNRTSSPGGGAETGDLNNGATIYDGDVLQISGGADEGYDFNGLLLNDNSFSSGETYTVSGAVSVSASASVKSYILSLSQGTGTSLSVYRSSSPNGGVSAGYLSDGSIIYYSDVLIISGSANEGYNFEGLTVNGEIFTSGNSVTVFENISIATIALVKSYTLTITQGTGTSLTVYRSSSPKAGAAAEYLNSGATIYYSDTLQINGSAQTGYDLDELIVNNNSFSSGDMHTVTDDVSVSISATVQQFILTINQSVGTIIIVDRTSSPNKGAETGNLESDAVIYYGDILQITASSISGWEIISLTVNDTVFSSGETITVSSNTIVASESKQQGLVYIGEDGVCGAYQAYIYNGIEWEMYAPYIKYSEEWALQS